MSGPNVLSNPNSTMTEHHRRILVVDDEASTREILEAYLTLEGYTVMQAATGLEALRQAQASPPDLVILDLMLPGIGGLEVCRRLRASSAVPILMVTALTDDAAQLAGFDAGTDDYITKPFKLRDVMMRVRAIMRRIEATSAPALMMDGTIVFGTGMVVRPHLREVERNGDLLDLTPTEFELLHFLVTHPKQAFTRQQLLDQVWHYTFYANTDTVTVHMRRLREKVELDPAHPRHLRTVRGVGYRFVP